MKAQGFLTKAKREGNQARTLNAQRRIAQSTLDATVLIEGISAAIIPCKARQSFTKGNAHVQAGQSFYLVRSENFGHLGRYYVMAWSEERAAWVCSCGADCRQHAHTNVVKAFIVEHVVKPKLAATVPASPVAEKLAEVREAASYVNDAPHPQTAEEWKVALAKQKEGDRKYRKAILNAAHALRDTA